MNGMRKAVRVADAAGVVLLGTMTLIISQSLSERAVWVYEGSLSLTVCSRSIFDHRTATVEIKPQRLFPNKLTQQLEAMKLLCGFTGWKDFIQPSSLGVVFCIMLLLCTKTLSKE